ncbi:DUF1127 domain-containing protein [Alphaproteobacteria bacterium KMM 3653]|uniref:DUF1127 domain-containing protein n=1 Tax=Harenicola maris TaxID=2841044 RepID=A0AAP2G647_9RHOB|nr:DUF1127 domain-containing protein [Harenicola maris]
MALFDATRTTASGGFFSKLFYGTIGAVADWNDRRVTRKALSGLTDRELFDIGLSRSDLANF